MSTKPDTHLVQEGDYLAQVEVNLIVTEDAWSPYLSDDDARKLDAVRRDLQRGDIAAASRRARVFRLMPVNAA